MAEAPLSEKAKAALDAFARNSNREPGTGRREEIWVRATGAVSRRRPGLWVGLAGASLAILALVLWSRPVAAPPAPLPAVAVAEVTGGEGARWSRSADEVTLSFGRLTLRATSRPMHITTPQLDAVLTNTVVLFDVTAAATVVSVESGEVVWRSGERVGTVRVGERAEVPTPSPQAHASSSLAAESALYGRALAAHERGRSGEATRLYRDYLQQFPDGTFVPDATVGVALELAAQGRRDEASVEASRFLERFPHDPRAPAMRRLRRP